MNPIQTPAVLLALLLASAGGSARAAPATPEDTPKPASSNLRWTAKVDEGVFGYIVLRSDKPDGPWLRVNEHLIRRDAEAAAPRTYLFVDDAVERGHVYWYRIESVSMAGVKKPVAGPLESTAD